MPASEPARHTLQTSRLSAWLMPIAAGLSFALLMAIAFPAVGFWPAAVLAPAPLAAVAVAHTNRRCGAAPPRSSRARRTWCALRTLLLVSLGVLPFQLYQHQFIINISAFGFFPLAAAMSLMVGLFVGLTAYCHARLPRVPLTLLAPVIWTGLEVLRGEIIGSGYSWLQVAYPLIDAPIAPLIGSVIGAYGVGSAVALLSGIAADLLLIRPRRWAWPVAGGTVLCGLGALAIIAAPVAPSRPPSVRIAVVQTNIPQDNKMDWELEQRVRDFDRFLELTQQAADATPKPDIIAWPETMFPGVFLDPAAIDAVHQAEPKFGRKFEALTYFAERLVSAQQRIGIPMFIGAMGFDNARLVEKGERIEIDDDGRYNSAFLVRGGRVEQRYDKMALTPFGEVMPGFRYWPWLQKMVLGLAANGMSFDLAEGKGPRAFSVEPGPVSIVTPICFEITKPGVCRKLALASDHRPTILLNLTNDGWFGGFDPAREQHLQIARWRAAELGVSVVRAANTGISAVIDPAGRVLARGVNGSSRAAQVDGTLTLDVAASAPGTIYSRTGDVLGWSALAGTALALVLARVRGRRSVEMAA